MSGSKVPNVTRCGVCSKEILAGTGLFFIEGDGGVHHVHVGSCARTVGAFPGGSAAVWGERAALASAMTATDGITEADAAEKVRFREPEPEAGFAVLDAIFTMLQVALLLFAVVCVFRIADHRGAFAPPVAHAETAVASDRVPGGSR